MTRISDYQLVQRVDERLVLIDESSGDEVTYSLDEVVLLQRAIDSLYADEAPQRVAIDVVLGNDAMQTWGDVQAAVSAALGRFAAPEEAPEHGDRIPVRDTNGNTVGEVVAR